MWGEKGKQQQKKETIFDEDHYTFLGKGVDFKGRAQFEGTVRVDGHFEGEIITNDTLIIGEHALIRGTIIGGIIICGGRVEGQYHGLDKGSVTQTGGPAWRCALPVFFNGRGSPFPWTVRYGYFLLE